MIWGKGMEILAPVLVSVDASRFLGWGPTEEDCCWLETLTDRAQSQILAQILNGLSVELVPLRKHRKQQKFPETVR